MSLCAVSACLAGQCCRYDGEHRLRAPIAEWVAAGKAIALCPEELGGLSTPRPAAEQQGKKVITIDGTDVTEAYKLGAQRALDVLLKHGVKKVYLKSKSPMCGSGSIYNGYFTGTLVPGDGVFARLCKKHGIEVEDVP
jgi:uncharacterized protein YbbK (DUF523 family)